MINYILLVEIKWHPPPVFRMKFHVGDTIQFIAQKGDREGGSLLCQLSKTPTPLSSQWEGGACLGRIDRSGRIEGIRAIPHRVDHILEREPEPGTYH